MKNPQTLTFLKLGGSLITVKSRPRTPRPEVLDRIAGEIAAWLGKPDAAPLLLGHGSGSFGHVPASKYGTRAGVRSAEEWGGFVEVWQAAADLNHLVLEALRKAGIPAVGFPPSAAVLAEDGRIAAWDLGPLRAALAAGLVPVIHGDVAYDRKIGGTVLSTEALFSHLAVDLQPDRILIAGVETGVWVDYPQRSELIPSIDSGTSLHRWLDIHGSEDTDVTGGMRTKVAAMLELVDRTPGLQVRIFGGMEPNSISEALSGAPLGTVLTRK
jgi:isopentenyl phosphate kinase